MSGRDSKRRQTSGKALQLKRKKEGFRYGLIRGWGHEKLESGVPEVGVFCGKEAHFAFPRWFEVRSRGKKLGKLEVKDQFLIISGPLLQKCVFQGYLLQSSGRGVTVVLLYMIVATVRIFNLSKQ